MKSLVRSIGVLALVAAFASAESLFAQINIGGFNSGGGNSNRDDDQDNNQNSNRQGNRRSQSNNQSNQSSSQQKLQKYLESQGLQGQFNDGQGGDNQFRGNQQGRNQGGQFQHNQNNQQFQNWNQNNQNNQSGVRLGTWQNGKWQGSNKIQQWTKNYGGEAQPFSSQWYQSHPKAWKYNNNNANVWVVGTLPGVYGWLGWGDVPREYRVNYGNVNYGHDHFDHAHYGDWYPLGVFSLMSGPGDDGTRIVQLVIDRHGHIAGNYYDMITAANYSVSGDISRNSQRVSWSLNKNQSVRFRAPLFALMQPYGTISVRLPGGEQQWQFVRLED